MSMHRRHHTGRLVIFFLISLLVHGVAAYTLGRFGRYDVTLSVLLDPVMVELGQPGRSSLPLDAPGAEQAASCQQTVAADGADEEVAEVAAPGEESQATAPSAVTPSLASVTTPPQLKETGVASGHDAGQPEKAIAVQSSQHAKIVPTTPVRNTGDFLNAKREKLTYQISVLGVPAGSAVLEAVNNAGELHITSEVTSNPVFSAVHPVANTTDTRMFNGNYIITNIRQQEGSSRSDIGYTLLLKEKKVFRADRIKKRYTNHPVPGDDVLDIITGLYFLRRQNLDVGTTLSLNLFDCDLFSPATVRVLRRERVRLPDMRTTDALVVQPVLENDGLFHTTGDVLVWLTDDEFKVPVRVEASVALGRITAELTSAETEGPGGSDVTRASR